MQLKTLYFFCTKTVGMIERTSYANFVPVGCDAGADDSAIKWIAIRYRTQTPPVHRALQGYYRRYVVAVNLYLEAEAVTLMSYPQRLMYFVQH